MKKVVLVNSSFRKGGNTEILAERFTAGAREAGNEVKVINLRDMNLKFCVGCLTCQKTGRCVLKDDVNPLLETVKNADVLVFATPVYYYCMSGQLKTFLDRMNPLFGQDNKFKEVYLLTAAADTDKSAMDGTVKGVQGWIDCFDKVELAGVVYGVGASDIGDISDMPAAGEAYKLGLGV